MVEVIRVGLDTSKQSFQVFGVDRSERMTVCRQMGRGQVEKFFAALPPTVVGLEACGASHYWARVLRELGHEVRLLPPQYVKPYVKRGKNDRIDAEAICEAMSRPSMRFVPVKSADEQAAAMLLSVRDLLVKQRTMLANAIRGHAAEFGVIGAKGMTRVVDVLERARESVPKLAWDLLAVLAGQLEVLEIQLGKIEKQLRAWHRENERSQRLATIPGVGPVGAMTMALRVPDPTVFSSGRHFASWIGLTPREHSTAGKQRLGKISREGDEALRRLLVVGATSIVKLAKRGKGPAWLLALLKRRPAKVVAVALANKMARIAWAMMVSGEVYRAR
ncbi:MAG: IS110 family transposase [Pseudomonadota bacterium]